MANCMPYYNLSKFVYLYIIYIVNGHADIQRLAAGKRTSRTSGVTLRDVATRFY